MPVTSFFAIITLLLSFSLAGAEMYQWIDENGVVVFKDTPPATRKGKKVKVYKESDFTSAPVVPLLPKGGPNNNPVSASQDSLPREHFAGTVEIFVTDSCDSCRTARRYMKSRNIPFIVYDIDKDSNARKRYKGLGGRDLPLILIGSSRMSGFSPESLEYYLNNSR